MVNLYQDHHSTARLVLGTPNQGYRFLALESSCQRWVIPLKLK